MVNFYGPATLLSDDDIAAAADELECNPAAVHAVLQVETSGCGFLKDKRPVILFESKSFGDLTKHVYDASHPNISTKVWDKTTYGTAGAHQYDRLEVALGLNEEAALMSASWGLFQIMGSNYQAAGFEDVESMVEAMVSGEAAHLDAFVSFVKHNNKMLNALRACDWATFARLYNGPGYAANNYDRKLSVAFDKWGTK